MDLFDYIAKENSADSPLAKRLRPSHIDDIIGQQHILGEGKLLRRLILGDRLSSLILFGPPGTGKTTIATVIANTTKAEFISINATTAGKKDMEEAVEQARNNKRMYSKKTILFVDEIHRFNKAQQDYLLPYVEDGVIILIGATTENPYYEVNKALLSRSAIYELYPLDEADIRQIIKKALTDVRNGLGAFNVEITEEAAALLAARSGGDARYAINAVELAVLTGERKSDEHIKIDEELILSCMGKKPYSYDKGADNHYDVASAFIKSMRGSDPNAAVYYLAKMIAGGEDPRFISRRIMICAAEDVGNADPNALILATSAAEAADRVGFPEARIILAQAAIYVALAPKSNASYLAIDRALALVGATNYQQPAYLKSEGYKKVEGKLTGQEISTNQYIYPHNYEQHYVSQRYLPEEIKDVEFFDPAPGSCEDKMMSRINELKKSSDRQL